MPGCGDSVAGKVMGLGEGGKYEMVSGVIGSLAFSTLEVPVRASPYWK